MAALTSTELTLLVVVLVIAVILVGLFLYLRKRLQNRRTKLLGELSSRPELIQDRAFNRIAMARREAGLLSDQGVDTHRAQELVAEAQGAFDTHQYDRAYQSAQQAHEALVNARRSGARSTGGPLASMPLASAGPSAAPAASSAPSPSMEPPIASHPSIPKNRAESQFQIRILQEELDALPDRRLRDHTGVEAAELKRRASAAFDQGDYTEAFRLALKGRRALGADLESLPPSAPARPLGTEPNGNGSGVDPTRTAETVAGGQRCPECGYPMLPGDGFCRGCGRPTTSVTCPSCGAERVANEPYCGKCGTRYP